MAAPYLRRRSCCSRRRDPASADKAKQRPSRIIARLTISSSLTRQTITKHLRVTQVTKLVRCTHSGREPLFELDPKLLIELNNYLNHVSHQSDQAPRRLKSFVEEQ